MEKFCRKYPEFDPLRLIEEVLTGESVMWATDEMFVIGRPIHYHNRHNFLLEALGGENYENWVDEIAKVEEDVRAWGFEEVEICARNGWKHIMGDQGYRSDRILMRKTL